MSRSTVKILIQYAVGFGIIAAVVAYSWHGKDGQPGVSIILERSPDFLMAGLALLVCAVGVALTFVRWYVLIVAQRLLVSPRDVVRLGLLGYFFNTFLPGSVGGDLVKSAFLVREQSRRTLAVATVAFDRIVGLAGLFWMVALLGGSLYCLGTFDPLLTDPTARYTLRLILVFAAAILGGTLFVWLALGWLSAAWLDRLEIRLDNRSKFGHSLAELVRALRTYRQKVGSVAVALGLSIVGHVCFVLSFYCGALVFNRPDEIPSFDAHLMIVPIGMVVRSMVPLPAGIGGGEIGYGQLYVWVGGQRTDGVIGSIAQLVCYFVLGFAALLIYGMMDKKRATPADVVPAGDLHVANEEPTPS